jgi:hypothetical protein
MHAEHLLLHVYLTRDCLRYFDRELALWQLLRITLSSAVVFMFGRAAWAGWQLTQQHVMHLIAAADITAS